MATAKQHRSTDPSPAPQPSFVVVEGMDGTGTTTIASLLADALRGRDQRVRVTAEPSKGPFGQLLRRHVRGELSLDPVTASLVFTADRADHVAREIRPALQRGEWVISDRYLLSTIAYQGMDVDRRAILAASQGFPVPAVTFVLEASKDVRTARMASRGRTDRYEDPALAERVRASYEQAEALLREAGHRIEKIDARPPAEKVLAEILRCLPP